MTRLELIVHQLGREPRVVPLAQTMTVGRSRKVDLSIDDEEVGREQFRVGIDGGAAFIEGLGTTNQTIVDGSVLAAGARRKLANGSTIRVGRTTVTLRDAAATGAGMPGEVQDMTMVAPRPSGPTPQGETTDGPLRTLPGMRPGARPPSEPFPPGPPRSPTSPPGAPLRGPTPSPEEPEQTMQVRGGQRYRPGQAPSPAEGELDATTAGPVKKERPADPTVQAPRGNPAPKPPSPPPAPPSPPAFDRTMEAPRAAPPKKPTPPPSETAQAMQSPAASAKAPATDPKGARPTTLAVNPVDIAAEISKVDLAPAAEVDVEARLHESLPRLFVKCDGMKRRVRLMKARNMLGRAESVDVLLPNESVSEQHAEITFDGKAWMLRDRGSTNGSFVDGGQLRGGSQELQRHSIIGLGNVRAIFLCNDRRDPSGQRRLEERAVKLLVQAKRLQAEAGKEALRVARADPSQSIAELLLMDTPLLPAEWATAVTTARSQSSLLDTLQRLFERLRRNRRAPKQR